MTPAIVIVNWNTRQQVLACLATLMDSTATGDAFPIIVVDNASTDGSVTAIRRMYPTVRILANTANRGYGAAINQGVQATTTPHVLVANADVECSRYDVEHLAAFLDHHPSAAVVGPRLVNRDRFLQLSWGREPSFWAELMQRWWWRRMEASPRQRTLRHRASQSMRVDWVLGACFMVRRAAFEAVGRVDEQYFMYFEEVDLCTRLRQAGWEIWYVPTAEAVHHGRASVTQMSEAMALAYRRSHVRYYRRFHGPWAARLLVGYLWAKLIWTTRGRRILQELSGATGG